MLINFHTHHPTLSKGCLEIESVYFGQEKPYVSPLRSVGLHPWYLEGIDLDAAADWMRTQVALPATCAIGEAGLDKACKTPWDLQVRAFKHCVELSEAVDKPLILHCVRAYSETIALKREWKANQNWIFHGFDKNPATAAMLLRAGCLLSFGAVLLRERSHAAESLRIAPPDCFFLETDDARVGIEAVYERAAAIRGTEKANLEKLLEGNFKSLVGMPEIPIQ